MASFNPLPLALGLALRSLGLVVVGLGAAGAGAGLGGDGAEQVLPLPEEVRVSTQPEAALPEDHPGGALRGPRAKAVLQLGEMSRVSV